jgi:hypothetical protein
MAGAAQTPTQLLKAELGATGHNPAEKLIQAAISAAYYQGLRDGVRRYSWWRGGVRYVGSGQFTLDEALARIDAAEEAGEWVPA